MGNDGQLIIVRMNLFVMYTVYCRFHMYIYIYIIVLLQFFHEWWIWKLFFLGGDKAEPDSQKDTAFRDHYLICQIWMDGSYDFKS